MVGKGVNAADTPSLVEAAKPSQADGGGLGMAICGLQQLQKQRDGAAMGGGLHASASTNGLSGGGVGMDEPAGSAQDLSERSSPNSITARPIDPVALALTAPITSGLANAGGAEDDDFEAQPRSNEEEIKRLTQHYRVQAAVAPLVVRLAAVVLERVRPRPVAVRWAAVVCWVPVECLVAGWALRPSVMHSAI